MVCTACSLHQVNLPLNPLNPTPHLSNPYNSSSGFIIFHLNPNPPPHLPLYQADPMLSRTVLVTTKLDTKLPQFSEASDLEDFLKAPLIHQLYSQLLGGPFFSSVPSGRVGISKDFDTNEAFVTALQIAERRDRSNIINRMGPIKARNSLTNVGVSRLRTFLEARVEDSYRKNIAKIVSGLYTLYTLYSL